MASTEEQIIVPKSAQKSQFPYIGGEDGFDIRNIHCGPMESNQVNGRKSVKLYANDKMQKPEIKLSLCRAGQSIETRYGLDLIKADQVDKTKRGLVVRVSDPELIEACRAFDDTLVAMAVKHSATWFKKTLTEEQVRSGYKPLLYTPNQDPEGTYCMKFKVKGPDAVVPTKIFRKLPNDPNKAFAEQECVLEVPGVKVVPCVSAFSIWFMGANGRDFGVSFQAEKLLIDTVPSSRNSLDGFGMSLELVEKPPESDAVPTSAAPVVQLVGGEGNDAPNEDDDPPAKKRKTEDDEGNCMGE
jgi:hypothetical protein